MTDTSFPSETEQSFLSLCEFEEFQVDNHVVKHNLSRWSIKLSDYRIKNGKIHVELTPPYAEMVLTVSEKVKDPSFLYKKTAHVTISEDQPIDQSGLGIMNYVTSQSYSFDLSLDTEYLLFNSPYFYPHNFYNGVNKNHLCEKISHSVNFLKYFLQAYKDTFQSGVPYMWIKETRETRNHYEITLILKEYMTISYVKSDPEIATIFFHMMIESAKKTNVESQRLAKFQILKLRFPREIKNTSNVKFKFTANMF